VVGASLPSGLSHFDEGAFRCLGPGARTVTWGSPGRGWIDEACDPEQLKTPTSAHGEQAYLHGPHAGGLRWRSTMWMSGFIGSCTTVAQ